MRERRFKERGGKRPKDQKKEHKRRIVKTRRKKGPNTKIDKEETQTQEGTR